MKFYNLEYKSLDDMTLFELSAWKAFDLFKFEKEKFDYECKKNEVKM